jgi:hypothetical protein
MKRIKKSLFWLAIVSTIIIFSAAECICGELRIDDCVWNSKSQSFNIKLSTQAGKVSVDKLKGYRIRSEIKISHDTRTTHYTLHGERALDAMTRARTRTRAINNSGSLNIPWDRGGRDLTGAVRARTRTRAINRTDALNIPWDRDGGSLTGAVRASVTVMLLDRSGVVVDKASYTKTMRVW